MGRCQHFILASNATRTRSIHCEDESTTRSSGRPLSSGGAPASGTCRPRGLRLALLEACYAAHLVGPATGSSASA
jgi:hypothetical protein